MAMVEFTNDYYFAIPPSFDSVFISGHRDITEEEFKDNYEPDILSYLGKQSTFVVGDCFGCDQMAANMIADYLAMCPASNVSLTIYHMFDEPRFRLGVLQEDGTYRIPPIARPNLPWNEWPIVRYVGGFEYDEERDAAMTRASTVDLAYIRDKSKWKSGTAQNLYRRHLMKNAE